LPLRKDPLEDLVLSTLQSRLLTPEHLKVFADEFKREVTRLKRTEEGTTDRHTTRLGEIDREIANLTANMLVGVLGPTLKRALAEREAERETLLFRLGSAERCRSAAPLPTADVTMQLFEARVADLRRSLNVLETCTEASEILAGLIGEVLVHPETREGGPEGEIVASTSQLVVFAQNAKRRVLSRWLRKWDMTLMELKVAMTRTNGAASGFRSPGWWSGMAAGLPKWLHRLRLFAGSAVLS